MIKRILVLLTLCAVAMTQAQGTPKDRSRYPTFLVSGYPSVRKDLGLSDSVSKKIARIQSESEKRNLMMISPTPANPNQVHRPSFAEIQAAMSKTENSILALLSTKQKARLRQIGYQYAGGFGIGEPEVAQALHITAAQRTKLSEVGRKALISYSQAMKSVVKNPHVTQGKTKDPNITSKEFGTLRVKMMKVLDADVAKILTAKQLAQWRQMQGKPFPVATLYAPVMKRAAAARS